MRREGGFSLVEMLAALTILSMSGLALMSAVTSAGRSAVQTRERALGAIAADNILNTAILEASPSRGMEDGSGQYELAGTVYEYEIEVEDAADPGLRRVTLIVSDSHGPVSQVVSFSRSPS